MPGLLSFIVPMFNTEKYLDECLAALRDQDYPAELVEILIVDGQPVEFGEPLVIIE